MGKNPTNSGHPGIPIGAICRRNRHLTTQFLCRRFESLKIIQTGKLLDATSDMRSTKKECASVPSTLTIEEKARLVP